METFTLDWETTLRVRALLASTVFRLENMAQEYERNSHHPRIVKIMRKRADEAFDTLNKFRVATGQPPAVLAHIMGED